MAVILTTLSRQIKQMALPLHKGCMYNRTTPPLTDYPLITGELPATEDYVVKEKTYEVKTCAVIESLDVESDDKPTTGFKKRRAKNLRKKTDG